MNAVGPPHANGIPILQGFPSHDGAESFKILKEDIDRILELRGSGAIQDIAGGKAQVKVPGILAEVRSQFSEKGDHIVPCTPFTPGNLRGVDSGPLTNSPISDPGNFFKSG